MPERSTKQTGSEKLAKITCRFSVCAQILIVLLLGSCGEQTPQPPTKDGTSRSESEITEQPKTPQPPLHDQTLFEVGVLLNYGHFLDALEIVTGELHKNPANENLLKMRTLIFLKAGQPELAALSNDEHARATSRNHADGLLQALLHENESVRIHAVQALEITQDPRRFEAVMPLAATDVSHLVRVAALRLLQKSDDSKLKSTFLALSRDDSWIVRAEAVQALSRWNDAEVRAAVWRATDDEEMLVRHRARTVICALFKPENLEEYRRMALGNDREMAVAAALALASAAHTEAVPVLLDALMTSGDTAIRRESARALSKVAAEDTAQILDALHATLSENETTLLSAVLDALEEIRDSRSIDPLSRFATNPLVPAVFSRRAFELLRTLRADLGNVQIGAGIFSSPDNQSTAEENTAPQHNEPEPSEN